MGDAHDLGSLHRNAGGGGIVGHVCGFVVESDILPDLQRGLQRRAGRRRLGENFRPFVQLVAAFVAGEDHRLQRHAIRGGAGLNAHGMADGAAAELQDDVFTEMIQQLMHLAGVNTA